ncbi:MAG: hypothetical protein HC921_02555 [Synechococcaceae cyanobacterium SM2_3_1]|nr:hypothetical protein [Synechococcaceae cyanobacterium SM2_3_1]
MGAMSLLSVTITGYQIFNSQITITEGQYDCVIVLKSAFFGFNVDGSGIA